MDTPLLTLFVAETLAFALLWHNKPARPQQEFAGLARFLRWLRLRLRFRKMPLREVIKSLPGFGGQADSRIDPRTLGASGQTVSPVVAKNRETETQNHIENIDESHRDSQLVTVNYEDSSWRREGDSNPRYGFTRITV